MGENIKNNISYIGKGIIISLIFTFICLLILSIILTYTPITESIETSSIIIINCISILIGSSISTIKQKSKGIIKGAITGGVYIGIIYLISSIVSMSFGLNISSIIMIISSLLAGGIGGIVGVNINNK